MTLPSPWREVYEYGRKVGEDTAEGAASTFEAKMFEVVGTVALVGLGAALIGAGLLRLFPVSDVASVAAKVAA